MARSELTPGHPDGTQRPCSQGGSAPLLCERAREGFAMGYAAVLLALGGFLRAWHHGLGPRIRPADDAGHRDGAGSCKSSKRKRMSRRASPRGIVQQPAEQPEKAPRFARALHTGHTRKCDACLTCRRAPCRSPCRSPRAQSSTARRRLRQPAWAGGCAATLLHRNIDRHGRACFGVAPSARRLRPCGADYAGIIRPCVCMCQGESKSQASEK